MKCGYLEFILQYCCESQKVQGGYGIEGTGGYNKRGGVWYTVGRYRRGYRGVQQGGVGPFKGSHALSPAPAILSLSPPSIYQKIAPVMMLPAHVRGDVYLVLTNCAVLVFLIPSSCTVTSLTLTSPQLHTVDHM